MGVVNRATDPVLNRPVAVKVMCDAIARDDDLRGRFLREAQAAGSLQHPNVITIYDFGEVDGHLFIAMEFVEGEDLEDLLARHISLSLADKLDVIIDVLAGLAFAHKRGIVHRDIKPANIRIDSEGRARVMDFGIAHLSTSSMTRTGVMVGTPAYMAPEHIVGTPVSPATDLFSVGTVLYELLTGSKPFQAETIQSVMYQIVSRPAAALDIGKLDIPAALQGVVDRALAKDAKDRYASAVEMANALTAIRAGLDRATSASKTVSLRSVIDMGLTAEREARQRQAKNRSVVFAGAGFAAIAASALFWFFARGDRVPPSAQLATGVAPVVPPAAVPSAPAVGRSATDSVSRAAPAPSSNKPSTASAAQQATPTLPKAEPKGPTTQEVLLVRALQTTALDSRRRAADAGATSDQLRAGDEHNRAADALVREGKVSEAAAKLNDATAAWNSAERDARLASAAASARAKTVTVDQPKTDPASIPSSAPPIPSPQAATKPAAPANPSVEIESAVAAYARAIESRDIAEVRRAYPGITAAQASGFEQFFTTVRSLRASFSVSSLDVTGSSAEGKLAGTYEYLTTAGKSERQAVTFQATFRRDVAGWKLASVR
jgi:serine/threonine-protein kinase